MDKNKPDEIDKDKLDEAVKELFNTAGKLADDVSPEGGWREHLRQLGLVETFLEEQKVKAV